MKKIFDIFLGVNSLIGRLTCVVIYVFVYNFMYKNFVFQLFYYMGNLEYVEMNWVKMILWTIISILPVIWYRGLTNVSSFFNFFIYIFIYIPFVHAIFVSSNISWFTIISYTACLCLWMILFLHTGQRRLFFKDLEITPLLPLRVIEVITISITVVFIALRGKSMHFVNFFTQMNELYTLRAQNADSGFVVYLQGWLSGAFYPFLLVCYLRQSKILKVVLILLGYLLLFMVDMQKLTFFLPFLLTILYIFLKIKSELICNRLHAYIIYCLVLLSIVLFQMQDNELFFTIGSLLLLRTVCVVGWLTQFYVHFFSNHPYTYYSHINIINFITGQYPYNISLGQAVSYETQNANANFFLTDGIAACGLLGVVVIGFLFLLLLDFINAISFKYDKTDMFVVFLPALSYILNTSLFTVMLSNGLIILILLLLSTNNPLIIKSNENENEKVCI